MKLYPIDGLSISSHLSSIPCASGEIIRPKMSDKKRNVIDKHVRAASVERKNKREFNEEEVVKSLSHLSQLSVQGSDSDINSSYSQSNKRKRAKKYHELVVSYAQLLPILVQKYQMPIISAKPRKPPYPKWYDLGARCEYHGRVQ